MSAEVVVAMMGLVVMALTFLGGVVLISEGDERLAAPMQEPAPVPQEVRSGYGTR